MDSTALGLQQGAGTSLAPCSRLAGEEGLDGGVELRALDLHSLAWRQLNASSGFAAYARYSTGDYDHLLRDDDDAAYLATGKARAGTDYMMM